MTRCSYHSKTKDLYIGIVSLFCTHENIITDVIRCTIEQKSATIYLFIVYTVFIVSSSGSQKHAAVLCQATGQVQEIFSLDFQRLSKTFVSVMKAK